jgi:tetratricopeptide (TPR) repeat protein
MKNKVKKAEKSLGPLILFLFVIIFLTLWIVNINVDKEKPVYSNKSMMNYNSSWTDMTKQGLVKKKSNLIKNNRTPIFRYNIPQELILARRLLENNKKEEAEDKLRTILVFKPNNTQALSLLGGILYYSGRYKEAEFIFKKESVLLPESALVYNSMASAQAKQRKYKDAITASQKALVLDPNMPQIHLNLAGMYSISGKSNKALIHLQKAYKMLGSNILPLINDTAFDKIRNTPKFQIIISTAKKQLNLDNKNTRIKQ